MVIKLKLKFKNQDFQTDAVNAVADLFQGHQKMRSTFEITQDAQMSFEQNDLGIYCFTTTFFCNAKRDLCTSHKK